MQQTYKTIEDDIIEDITEETLLSLDETLEADAESTEIAEAKVKEEEEDDEDDKEDADDMEEALDSVGKEDDDVDNDGDSDETDEYLKNRRKKIAAAIEKQNEDVKTDAQQLPDLDTLSPEDLWDLHAKHNAAFDDANVSSDSGNNQAHDKTISKFVSSKFGKDMADDMRKASELYSYAGSSSVNAADINALRKKHNVKGIDAVEKDDAADKVPSLKKEDIAIDSSDITRLVESEDGLTEEFKEKATLIFETAVRSKVAETEAVLKEEYATRLAEEVETIQEDLVEKIDSYLTYAVESWVADNKVAVESTLRTEIAENFISSLKSVFVENYIDVPEGKTDLVAQMETKLTESQEQAEKLERIAESLAEKVEILSRTNVLAEASRDLADTQVAKLQSLAEDVQYVDADSFRKKVETLKEFYINSRQSVEETIIEDSSYVSTETIVENETFGEQVSPSMQQYLTAISRLNNASTANIAS